jgi:hypothetical protein
MVHQHVPAELLILLNKTWARLFARLRSVLAGRPAGPHPLVNMPRRLAELEADGGFG